MPAAYDRKGHAPGSAPGAGPPPSAAGRRSKNASERCAPPSDIEPLFHFCRHCGGDYTPQEGGIEGVCPECAQHLYTRCNERGATVPAADARRPSSGRTLCRSCATRLCCTCRGCGELHERSSTDFLVDAYGQTVCSSCWDDWEECSECGEYFPADDLEKGEDADEMLCRRCAARRGGRLIHPYSYKPEPIFHRAEGEGADALALGIELEMDGGSPEWAARGILALAGDDYLYFKRDSSLEDGAELVTHRRARPCSCRRRARSSGARYAGQQRARA